jgi:predicted RNA binding protein YcfA (HicA-like mRNA interferase family)
MKMPGRYERVVIPMHGNQSLKIGLLRSLMRIIPIAEDEL